MENRREPNNSGEISKTMSNDCENDAVHLYPICKHAPHVRKPPAINKQNEMLNKVNAFKRAITIVIIRANHFAIG